MEEVGKTVDRISGTVSKTRSTLSEMESIGSNAGKIRESIGKNWLLYAAIIGIAIVLIVLHAFFSS